MYTSTHSRSQETFQNRQQMAVTANKNIHLFIENCSSNSSWRGHINNETKSQLTYCWNFFLPPCELNINLVQYHTFIKQNHLNFSDNLYRMFFALSVLCRVIHCCAHCWCFCSPDSSSEAASGAGPIDRARYFQWLSLLGDFRLKRSESCTEAMPSSLSLFKSATKHSEFSVTQ